MCRVSKIAHRSVRKVLVKDIQKYFNEFKDEFEVNTPLRESMFWAQMAHETGGLRWLAELGGPSYFAKYDGRTDLGNIEPGDGYRFKGRGLIHVTGRYNYKKYGDKIGINLIEYPKMASEPRQAVLIALHYWKDHRLNKYADIPDIRAVTRRINGGYNGLADRKRYFKMLQEV